MTNPRQAKDFFYSLYASVGLAGLKISSFDPSLMDSSIPELIFLSSATPAQIATIQAAAASFDWTGATLPDYQGFLTDCQTDPNAPNFPEVLIYCAAIANPVLTTTQRKALITSAVTYITAKYPAQATAIINQVKAYADARNVPLA